MTNSQMTHCMQCGAPLVMKKHPQEERDIPFCESCGEYRFPLFNTAVSMIVLNPAHDRILLIKQYGKPFYILVAGYVNQGEDAEDTVVREIAEELGVDVADYRFNHSHYFPPTNTLMLNYTVTLAADELSTNWEIDDCTWFTFSDAEKSIKPGSLAKAFLHGYLNGGDYVWPDL